MEVVIANICCAQHAQSQPFMSRSTVRTSISCPFRSGTLLGLCDWAVKGVVFPTFNWSPAWTKHLTSSSNKNCVPSAVLAMKSISSANLTSKTVHMLSWQSTPALPTFRHERARATSKHTRKQPRTQYTSFSHASPDTKRINLHHHCCLQSTLSGHTKNIAKPRTCDPTLHVRTGFTNFPSFSRLTLSNVFDKSKLKIRTGTSSETVFWSTRFVVNKCSSMRASASPGSESTLFSGCPSSKIVSIRIMQEFSDQPCVISTFACPVSNRVTSWACQQFLQTFFCCFFPTFFLACGLVWTVLLGSYQEICVICVLAAPAVQTKQGQVQPTLLKGGSGGGTGSLPSTLLVRGGAPSVLFLLFLKFWRSAHPDVHQRHLDNVVAGWRQKIFFYFLLPFLNANKNVVMDCPLLNCFFVRTIWKFLEPLPSPLWWHCLIWRWNGWFYTSSMACLISSRIIVPSTGMVCFHLRTVVVASRMVVATL